MGSIHRTPHLAHVILLLVISISHSSFWLSALTFISIFSIQFQHVINWSVHPISIEISTSYSDYYTCFCACSVMFYFSCTLSYMISTFQVRTHTCTTSSRDLGSGSQHPDHADSLVSPYYPRTTIMSFISFFSHLVSVFARFSWGLSQYF